MKYSDKSIKKLIKLVADSDNYCPDEIGLENNLCGCRCGGADCLKCWQQALTIEAERKQISDKIKNDYPNGAIVVSSSEYFCKSFIRACDLNPKLFKVATQFNDFEGKEPDTPIILTCYQNRNGFSELRDMIDVRFKNVKYIDY